MNTPTSVSPQVVHRLLRSLYTVSNRKRTRETGDYGTGTLYGVSTAFWKAVLAAHAREGSARSCAPWPGWCIVGAEARHANRSTGEAEIAVEEGQAERPESSVPAGPASSSVLTPGFLGRASIKQGER